MKCESMLYIVKRELNRRRQPSKATLKDIQTVINWKHAANHGATYTDEYFNKVKQTKLYNIHNGEYCELLEILY